MRRDDFDRALRKALSELPPMFRDALSNVAVVVEEWAPDDLLDELGVPADDTLYGFYHGRARSPSGRSRIPASFPT